MQFLTRWILPVAFVAIGIAIFSGWLLSEIPKQTYLRPILGAVAVLLGVHRYVASRVGPRAPQRRRYGGERHRPWED
jgi:hypothetical protein